jgi:hypothetical protein
MMFCAKAKAIVIRSLAAKLNFLPIFIQNMFQQKFYRSSSRNDVLCRAKAIIIIRSLADKLHFYQSSSKTCCFVQSQSHYNKNLGRQITFLPIFIQNMLSCVEWSSSKTWCDKNFTDLHPKHDMFCAKPKPL